MCGAPYPNNELEGSPQGQPDSPACTAAAQPRHRPTGTAHGTRPGAPVPGLAHAAEVGNSCFEAMLQQWAEDGAEADSMCGPLSSLLHEELMQLDLLPNSLPKDDFLMDGDDCSEALLASMLPSPRPADLCTRSTGAEACTAQGSTPRLPLASSSSCSPAMACASTTAPQHSSVAQSTAPPAACMETAALEQPAVLSAAAAGAAAACKTRSDTATLLCLASGLPPPFSQSPSAASAAADAAIAYSILAAAAAAAARAAAAAAAAAAATHSPANALSPASSLSSGTSSLLQTPVAPHEDAHAGQLQPDKLVHDRPAPTIPMELALQLLKMIPSAAAPKSPAQGASPAAVPTPPNPATPFAAAAAASTPALSLTGCTPKKGRLYLVPGHILW